MFFLKFRALFVNLFVCKIFVLQVCSKQNERCLDIPISFDDLNYRMGSSMLAYSNFRRNFVTIFLDDNEIQQLDTKKCVNDNVNLKLKLDSNERMIIEMGKRMRDKMLVEPQKTQDREFQIHKILIDLIEKRKGTTLEMSYDNDKNNSNSLDSKYKISFDRDMDGTSSIFSLEIIFPRENLFENITAGTYSDPHQSIKLPNKMILKYYERIIGIEILLEEKNRSFFSSFLNVLAIIVLLLVTVVFSIIGSIAFYQNYVNKMILKKQDIIYRIQIQSSNNDQSTIDDDDDNYDIETTQPVLALQEPAQIEEDNYDMLSLNQEAPASNWLNQASNDGLFENEAFIQNGPTDKIELDVSTEQLGLPTSNTHQRNAFINEEKDGALYTDASELNNCNDSEDALFNIRSKNVHSLQTDETKAMKNNVYLDVKDIEINLATNSSPCPSVEFENAVCQEKSDIQIDDEEVLKELNEGNFDRIKVVNSIYYLEDCPTDLKNEYRDYNDANKRLLSEKGRIPVQASLDQEGDEICVHEDKTHEKMPIKFPNHITLERPPFRLERKRNEVNATERKVSFDTEKDIGDHSKANEEDKEDIAVNNLDIELTPPLPPRSLMPQSVPQPRLKDTRDVKNVIDQRNLILNSRINKNSNTNHDKAMANKTFASKNDDIDATVPPLPPRTDLLQEDSKISKQYRKNT